MLQKNLRFIIKSGLLWYVYGIVVHTMIYSRTLITIHSLNSGRNEGFLVYTPNFTIDQFSANIKDSYNFLPICFLSIMSTIYHSNIPISYLLVIYALIYTFKQVFIFKKQRFVFYLPISIQLLTQFHHYLRISKI